MKAFKHNYYNWNSIWPRPGSERNNVCTVVPTRTRMGPQRCTPMEILLVTISRRMRGVRSLPRLGVVRPPFWPPPVMMKVVVVVRMIPRVSHPSPHNTTDNHRINNSNWVLLAEVVWMARRSMRLPIPDRILKSNY